VDRKLYQWISELVRDKPGLTTDRSLTPLGREVLTRYGCGYVSKNHLIFSAEDKRRLRQLALDEFRLDPFLVEQLPETRLEMAQYHADEKLAAKPASEDLLLLNSADGIIRVNGEEIPLHPQSLTSAGLLCVNTSINTVEHESLVVVENLAIMPLCRSWRIPCVDTQALWVYRGDYKSGATASACRDFVEHFGTDKTVIVFSDMDPKGLEIALTMPHVEYWLGPEQSAWQTCLQSKLANRVGFDLQSGALTYLERCSKRGQLSDKLNQLLTCLNEERSSFRQEHMFCEQVGLQLLSVNSS